MRQSIRDGKEKKRQCQRYMEGCSFFSIAIDSALVGNEHLFACFSRFCFEDSVVQIPLFFDVCHRATGNDIAQFVFNKLLDFNPVFEKLVSVSTDGASNMIGRASGMAARLKLLIRQHCATRQVPFNNFHSVWCFAHRLNLVTKDLMQMKGVNIVKAFADWFSDRRRQTNYKMFVSETTTEEKLRRIPQPSETRWTFYHDVVSAILSQHAHVEDFITVMPCFAEFWNSLRLKRQQYGLLVDRPFTFSDVELYHLFQFAEVVLALLKRANLFLQERYLMVCDSWSVINSLMTHVSKIKTTLHQPPSSLSFLSGIDQDKLQDYSTILQHLLQSLQLRFASPSSSFDMKRKRTASNLHFGPASTGHNPFANRCSLSEKIDMFSFCSSNDIDFQQATQRDLMNEVYRVCDETNQRRDEIARLLNDKKRVLSETVGFDVDITMTFEEAIQIVGKEGYPLLWKEIQKMKTVMATTVCCEQSFSVLKRALHVNMKKETVIANITAKFDKRIEAREI